MKKVKDPLESYRIVAANVLKTVCNYSGNTGFTFRNVHETFYPIILRIKKRARKLGVKYFWHFYEPYIEITWMSDKTSAEKLFKYAKREFKKINVKDAMFQVGLKDYGGPDWYGNSGDELLFGAKRHAASSDLIEYLYEHRDSISKGKGIEAQIQRTIHTICNPHGINFEGESRICFRQAWNCYLMSLRIKYPKIFTDKVCKFILFKLLRLKG